MLDTLDILDLGDRINNFCNYEMNSDTRREMELVMHSQAEGSAQLITNNLEKLEKIKSKQERLKILEEIVEQHLFLSVLKLGMFESMLMSKNSFSQNKEVC